MSRIVNKLDLTKDVADLIDLPQVTVKKVMDATWDVIKRLLSEGQQVSIVGFGNFYVKNRAARIGRNPKTGSTIQIGPSRTANFKAGKLLKDAVKENNEIVNSNVDY